MHHVAAVILFSISVTKERRDTVRAQRLQTGILIDLT